MVEGPVPCCAGPEPVCCAGPASFVRTFVQRILRQNEPLSVAIEDNNGPCYILYPVKRRHGNYWARKDSNLQPSDYESGSMSFHHRPRLSKSVRGVRTCVDSSFHRCLPKSATFQSIGCSLAAVLPLRLSVIGSVPLSERKTRTQAP